MDSVRIPWNSNILLGIWQILLELMGEIKDLVVAVVIQVVVLTMALIVWW